LARSPSIAPITDPVTLITSQLYVVPTMFEVIVCATDISVPLQTVRELTEVMVGLLTTVTGNGSAAGDVQPVPLACVTVTFPLKVLICTIIELAVTGSEVMVAPDGKLQAYVPATGLVTLNTTPF
jgi:hypothetical protein